MISIIFLRNGPILHLYPTSPANRRDWMRNVVSGHEEGKKEERGLPTFGFYRRVYKSLLLYTLLPSLLSVIAAFDLLIHCNHLNYNGTSNKI